MEGRGFVAACQMLGMAAVLKRRKAGESYSAMDVAEEATASGRLDDVARGLQALMGMSREEQTRIIGVDPRSVTPERMTESWNRMFGEAASDDR